MRHTAVQFIIGYKTFLNALLIQTTIAYFPYTIRETNSCAERGTSGLICDSCDLLATCVRVSHGWITVPVETCDTDIGYYCNLNERSCSNRTGPCHPSGFEGNFACTSEGVFPDPYDCQKYHMCYRAGATLVSANIDCGTDKSFSASTGDCSLTIYDLHCQEKQYKCANSGDSGIWPGNENIFYICKATINNGVRILYPTLYRCSSGEIFNGYNCIPKQDLNNNENNVTVTSIIKTSTVEYDPNLTKCSENKLQSDPNDCHSYFYCTSKGVIKRYTCPKNTYFNQLTFSCTFGTC